MDVVDFVGSFDPLLQKDIQVRLSNLKNIAEDNTLESYLQTILPFINSGKRIRPYVVALAYTDIQGNNWEDITNQLLALEYFHTFALVHDDIMDRSHTRRGVPTIHTSISNKIIPGDTIHAGYSQAIIIGDLLHSFSQQLFISSNNSNIQEAYKAFTEMSNEVMLGQMLDLDLINRTALNVSTDLIVKKMFLKTAGYTFVNPLKIGSILSGRNKNKFYTKFGTALGIAFQIRDDILDIVGTKEETGKTPLCDVKEGQKTILTDYISKKAKTKHKNELLKYLGKEFSEIDHNKIRNIFIDSGAIRYAEEIVTANLDTARSLLGSSDLSQKTQIDLSTLIDKLQIRK